MSALRGLWDARQGRDDAAVNRILDASLIRLAVDDPGGLQELFAALPPQWYSQYPRHALSRALVEALNSSTLVLAPEPVAVFAQWVADQDAPALRDVLALKQTRMLELLERGWYQDAANEADAILAHLRTAPSRIEGFDDLMPAFLLACGKAKLLASDLDGALACFVDIGRWDAAVGEHPLARYGREHLALVHALNEEFHQAARHLLPAGPAADDRVSDHHFRAAGQLARILVDVGALRLPEAAEQLDRVDPTLSDGNLGWIVLHAEAVMAIAKADPWEVIHRIHRRLECDHHQFGPATLPGSVLRADLASLYQVADDLRAADRTLRAPEVPSSQSLYVVALARQALILGRPDQAMSVLQRDEISHATTIPARFRASGAVLYASAELALGGSGRSAAQELATSAVLHSGARSALMGASSTLRDRVFSALREDAGDVPSPWSFRTRIRLTQREQEVLRALREHRTLNEVASSLHVSLNTAKTHVRTLYRKLDVHSREEALWIGRDLARR